MDLARAGVACDCRSVYIRNICTRCHQRPTHAWTLRHPVYPPGDAGARPDGSARREAYRASQVAEPPVLVFSSESAELDASERAPGLRPGKGAPLRLLLHAGVLPGLQPFQSREFRRAHHRRSLQQRRWASLNLSAAVIRSNHACCAACTTSSPCMPAVHAQARSDAFMLSHAARGAAWAAAAPAAPKLEGATAAAVADLVETTHAMRGSISFGRNLVAMSDGMEAAAVDDASLPVLPCATLPVIRVRRDEAPATPSCPALAPRPIRPTEDWSPAPAPVRVAAAIRALPLGAARAALFPPRLTVSSAARHFRHAGAAHAATSFAPPPVSARSSPLPCPSSAAAAAESLPNTELLGQVLSSFSMASPTGASVDGSGLLMSDASSEPDIVVVKQPHDIFLSPRAAHSAPGLCAAPRLAAPPAPEFAFTRPARSPERLGTPSYDSDSGCSCTTANVAVSPRADVGPGAFAAHDNSAMLLETPEPKGLLAAAALEGDPWSVASSSSLLMRSLAASTPASLYSPAAETMRGTDWPHVGSPHGLPLAATVVCENPLFESAFARACHEFNAIRLPGGPAGSDSILAHAMSGHHVAGGSLFSAAREHSVSNDYDRISAQSTYTAAGDSIGGPLAEGKSSAASMQLGSGAEVADNEPATPGGASGESLLESVGGHAPCVLAADRDEAEGLTLLDALRRASMDSQRLLSPRVDADGLCGDWELV